MMSICTAMPWTRAGWNGFWQRDSFVVEKRNFKGKSRTRDLRKMTEGLKVQAPDQLRIVLKNDQGRTIRPMEILQEALKVPGEILRNAQIIKLKQDTISC